MCPMFLPVSPKVREKNNYITKKLELTKKNMDTFRNSLAFPYSFAVLFLCHWGISLKSHLLERQQIIFILNFFWVIILCQMLSFLFSFDIAHAQIQYDYCHFYFSSLSIQSEILIFLYLLVLKTQYCPTPQFLTQFS